MQDWQLVNKQRTDFIWSFNLKELREVEGKEQCDVEISSRFAALINLDAVVDNNRAWETIRENIKISAE
jgi:hypothetical protein